MYKSAINRFSAFCSNYVTQPFPVNEQLLCRFIAALAREGLTPGTIKTYLAGVRHAQIIRGLPEPRETGSMPRLKLVQAGVARDRVNRGIAVSDQRLPITARILRGIVTNWVMAPRSQLDRQSAYENTMLAAAVSLVGGAHRAIRISF